MTNTSKLTTTHPRAVSVPEGFRLPWSHRTMADAWNLIGRQSSVPLTEPKPVPRPRAEPQSHSTKIGYAGKSSE